MIETGRIVEIKKRLVIVQCGSAGSEDTGDHCFGCMNQECKKKEGCFSALNPLGLPLKNGQSVTIEVSSSSLAVQGIQAALPPVLGFIAGFAGMGFLFPVLGEGLRILAGLILMAAAGAGFYVFRRKFPAEVLPKVTGIAVK